MLKQNRLPLAPAVLKVGDDSKALLMNARVITSLPLHVSIDELFKK